MKRIILITFFIPMIGCANVDTNETGTQSSNKQPVVSIAEKDKGNNSSTDKIKTTPYTISDVNEKVINTRNPDSGGNLLNQKPMPESKMLDVVLIKQNPELKYGCEITSLAMMLNYAGIKTNKMELYRLIAKDPDPLVKSNSRNILKWGNPNEGFVGDMTGNQPGYAVFDKPMINLINQKLPGRAVNLTNQPFERILEHVAQGYPVVVWTTGDYRLPDRWEAWRHGTDFIKTPLDLHAVVLVGYDASHVYLNDPLSGKKQTPVAKNQFISSWKALQSRAVSYK